MLKNDILYFFQRHQSFHVAEHIFTVKNRAGIDQDSPAVIHEQIRIAVESPVEPAGTHHKYTVGDFVG